MNLQTDSTKRWLLNNKRAQNIIEVSRLQTIDFISLLTWKFVTLITLFPFSLASSFLLNGGNSYVHIFSYFHKSIRSKISNVFYCDIFINEYRYLIQNLERFSKKKRIKIANKFIFVEYMHNKSDQFISIQRGDVWTDIIWWNCY